MQDRGGVWLPEQASSLAGDVDALFNFILYTSVVLFATVIGSMIYLALRYRRRSQADCPSPFRENKWLELSWIVIPTVLVTIVFTWGFKVFIRLNVAPPNSYEVTVRASKWSWLFEYPNGARSNTLHVPVRRPVKLRMSSSDVIHSLYVPAFRIKMDVLPRRYTYAWFEATRQDTFPLMCTEYCGQQHSTMLANVVVLSQDEFNAWLQSAVIDESMPPSARGELLFVQQGCQACHSVDGTPGVGPSLLGIAMSERVFADGTRTVADDNYLRDAILNPAAQVVQGYAPLMPGQYAATLTSEEIDALVAYLQELQVP